MLKRLLEQKDAIVLLSTKAEVNISVEMTADDWKTMKFGVELLEIFETATIQLSKETSTISEVSFLIDFGVYSFWHTTVHFLHFHSKVW